MKKSMTRIGCFLLVLVLLAGLLPVLTVGAAATTLEEKQRAIVLTALAYFDKGRPVQYDSIELSVVAKGKGGARRITMETPPEFATKDETWFSVCSDYPYQCYFDVFGYKLCGNPVANWTGRLSRLEPGKDAICTFRYNSHTDTVDRTEAISQFCAQLQPGDVINTVKEISGNGHALFYIGDAFGDGTKYLVECSGYKYNTTLGEDRPECKPGAIETIEGKINPCVLPDSNDGGISLHPCEEWLLKEYGPGRADLVLSCIRPLNEITDEQYPMSASAKARMQFPRLVYNRTANKTRFNDIEEGGTLTLSVELQNFSKNAYTVPVKEIVPEGVSFVKASEGAKVDGKNLSWDVAVPAGGSTTVSYDCTVTAKRGETITFAGGSASTIPSNTICIKVGGKHLTDAENAILADIPNGSYKPLYKGVTKEAFVPIVWQKILKLNVKLPTMQDAVNNMYKQIEFGGKRVYVLRDDLEGEWKTYRDMLVPEFAGGLRYGMMDTLHRVLDIRCEQLQPGDIVYEVANVAKPNKGEVMVYLGNEKFLRQVRSDGGAAVMDFFELQKAHTSELFFALRPTLAYDDVHTLS